ncbi:MAG: 2Fe-2S iron-sulfur cluster-binding protein, partial [Anaerolineales bacterium]|nr:2Fe-2S iron-sulfur cluster-binding protein [Anaerolineales bacterium]
MSPEWSITLSIFRSDHDTSGRFDQFEIKASPDEYVLDLVERTWAKHDRSITFAQACHHSVCGACGMVVNGIEKLTCITPVRSVSKDGGLIKVEPLKNFPVISDLAVDMSRFYIQMEEVGFKQVVPVGEAPIADGIAPSNPASDSGIERLVDCIECGLCLSACPIVATNETYVGPAVLAAVQQEGLDGRP